MSNEIAKYHPQQMTLADVRELAKDVVTSKLFQGIDTIPSAVALMMLCQAEGLHPIQAMRIYHLIEGKPSKRAMAILAHFKQAGGKVQWHERTDQVCEATFTAPDGDSAKVKWTMKDAQSAGLASKQNWQRYARRMLTSRVISEAVGLVMPAVVVGIGIAEELEDGDDFVNGEAGTGRKGPKLFDKLQRPSAATPAVGAIVDAEIVDTSAGETEDNPPPPTEENAPPLTVATPTGYVAKPDAAVQKFAMPQQDTDRLPAEILSKKRKLVDQPFLEQSDSDLGTTIATLRELANGAKDPHNKMVLQVYAAIADTCMNAKRKAVAP